MKLRKITIRTREESIESQLAAKRYNPATELRHNRRWFTLSCGSSDHITAWAMGWELYVLSQNPSLGYVGLEVFDSRDGCLRADFFSQNACDEMRDDIFDLVDATVLREAMQYVS